MLDSDEEKAKLSKELVDVVGKEIEPLLKDAKPFFGGSGKVTLAEVRRFPRSGSGTDIVTGSDSAFHHPNVWACKTRHPTKVNRVRLRCAAQLFQMGRGGDQTGERDIYL